MTSSMIMNTGQLLDNKTGVSSIPNALENVRKTDSNPAANQQTQQQTQTQPQTQTSKKSNQKNESSDDSNKSKEIAEKINEVGNTLLNKQTQLKTYAPLSQNDPILFFMNTKVFSYILLGSFIAIFVNNSF